MDKLVQALKILADGNRLRIVKLLERKPMCVCELAFVLRIKQPSVSRHLKKMREVGLVAPVQDGLWTNYVLTKHGNALVGEFLSDLGKRLDQQAVILADAKRVNEADRQHLGATT